MDEELLTVNEVVARKGVTKTTVYRAIERGQLAAVKVLGTVGIRAADAEAYEPCSFGARPGAKRRRGPGRPRNLN